MPSTSRGYPYPSGSDDVDIPGDMQALADALNTDVGTVVTNAAAASAATIQNTLADAAGDLIVASANDLWAKKPLGTDNHVLTVDTAGSGVAKVGWEDPTANPLTTAAMAAKVNTATVGNLLTANQASVETSIDWWTNLGARDAGDAAHGAASILFTMPSAAASYMQGGYGTSGIPVTAGQTYTAYYVTKNVVGTRTTTPEIEWYNDSSYLSVSTGTAITPSSSEWSVTRLTAVAPANATRASQVVRVGAGSTSDQMRVDKLGFWEGAGGQWALPGTPITNQGFYTDESCGRRLFQWDANNSRFQQTYGDTGWRTVTSLVDTSGWTNAPTALAVYVRRTLEQSSMIVQWNPGTGSCSGQGVLTLPPGFGPAAGIIAPGGAWHSADAGAYTGGWYWETGTKLDLQSPATSVYLRAIATLPCTAAWPTTLPGTASGSIPA